jgi:hypothetical protein
MSRHKDRLEYYVWLAEMAEKGKITSIFFADLYGTHETYGGNADATFKGGLWVAMLDPVVLISAMAQATKSVSFAVTGSTSYLSKFVRCLTSRHELTSSSSIYPCAYLVITGPRNERTSWLEYRNLIWQITSEVHGNGRGNSSR